MIMFCYEWDEILLFSLFPWHYWCCIFLYQFSTSTHGRPTCFFLLFAFTCIFQESQKFLSSTHSLCVQCWNGDSTKPDLTCQYSGVQRETQIFPYLFSSACYHSGCLAPVWSLNFSPFFSPTHIFLWSLPEKICARYGYILLNLESEFTGRYWLVLIPDGVCSSVRVMWHC